MRPRQSVRLVHRPSRRHAAESGGHGHGGPGWGIRPLRLATLPCGRPPAGARCAAPPGSGIPPEPGPRPGYPISARLGGGGVPAATHTHAQTAFPRASQSPPFSAGTCGRDTDSGSVPLSPRQALRRTRTHARGKASLAPPSLGSRTPHGWRPRTPAARRCCGGGASHQLPEALPLVSEAGSREVEVEVVRAQLRVARAGGRVAPRLRGPVRVQGPAEEVGGRAVPKPPRAVPVQAAGIEGRLGEYAQRRGAVTSAGSRR